MFKHLLNNNEQGLKLNNDDAQMIRSQVLSSKSPRGYIEPIYADYIVTPVAPKTGIESCDVSGVCERFTVLNVRSNYTKVKHVAAITLLGLSVFGGLVLIKGKDPKNVRKQA